MNDLAKKAFGTSALWIPEGSVITRRGFSIFSNKIGDIGGYVVEKDAPFIYVVMASRVTSRKITSNLLNIIYARVVGDENGVLETGSFKEMVKRSVVSPIESPLKKAELKDSFGFALYNNPNEHIGDSVKISSLRRNTLYKVMRPLIVDYRETLLT